MMLQNAAASNGMSLVTHAVAQDSRQATEQWLVEAAKRGQSSAFATLCERYMHQLQRATHRITKSREDAEDAVQDALMRGFVHVREFNGQSSFGTWLTRIAINSALMILRKRRNSLEVAMETSDETGATGLTLQIPDRAPSPEKRCAQNEEERILKRAIRKLRPSLQEVVRMQQLQERSVRETAQAIGISVAATKARLFHAKVALRKSSILRMTQRPRTGRPLPFLTAA